jgi:hypothetical protein
MLLIDNPESFDLRLIDNNISQVILPDHLGGFDQSMNCSVLETVNRLANGRKITVDTEYVFDQKVRDRYPNLNLRFSAELHDKLALSHFLDYREHPVNQFENFLCTFNGSPHVSRKLLVSILYNLGIFDTKFCSKNFKTTADIVDGHILDCVGDNSQLYRKFFLSNNIENFLQSEYSFDYQPYNHKKNIQTLEHRLTKSFVHLVSDTMATSFYPFYGEKFLYSVVTRGLFVSYSQPGWHSHLETYYGFKKYSKIFNYNFDEINNPVERLVELVSMLLKFKYLTPSDWNDLYNIESDTIEFNYDHYFSGRYLKKLNSIEN